MPDAPLADIAAAEETPPCLSCGMPSQWTSPTGHSFCQTHRDIFSDLFPPEGLQPVDLRALMAGERPDEDWLIEPVLPAGKLVGIVSKRGEGKSLLMLDMAAAAASGTQTLSQPAGEPVDVIYVDMEMGPDDLYERLADLGWLPDHPKFGTLVEHLHYYQLVALPPLDTEAGGIALEQLVERHGAKLVVIDTVSRVVSGEENSAEPYRDLFRHTETMLKRRRVTLARLDHLGKDKERGSRGSSAKEDPLDVVWHLTHTVTGAIELTLTKGRQGWLPRIVTVHKDEDNGTFRHAIHEEVAEQWLVDLARDVDGLGLDRSATVAETQTALQTAGRGRRKDIISQVVRFRKGQKDGSQNGSRPSGTKNTEPTGNRGNQTPNTHINIDLFTGTVPGTENAEHGTFGFPLRREPRAVPDPDDDFDPDPDDLPDPFGED